MVGAAMGTATLSHDNRYWAVPVKIGARFHFIVIDTRTGRHETILEADTIGHPEFHPSDNGGYVFGRVGVAQGGGRNLFLMVALLFDPESRTMKPFSAVKGIAGWRGGLR